MPLDQNKKKQWRVLHRYRYFTDRYRVFLDGLPYLATLLVGYFILSQFTKRRYVNPFPPGTPSKEELLEAGIDMDTDLATEELESELKKMKEKVNIDSWENIKLNK